MERIIKTSFEYLLYFLFFFITLLCSYILRSTRHNTPRVVWGPTPLKPMAHSSAAVKKLGHNSMKWVDAGSSITNRNDFNFYSFDDVQHSRYPILSLKSYYHFYYEVFEKVGYSNYK
jgi:hypothetical protein